MIDEFDSKTIKEIVSKDKMVQLIKKEDSVGVKQLINSGYNLENNIIMGMTPLMFAALLNSTEVAKLLIELGANINAIDNYKQTPLIHTIQNESSKVAELLLSQEGINIESKSDFGWTALIYAIKYNKVSMVKLLLEANADVNVCVKKGSSTLYLSILFNKSDNTISKLLIDYGADISYRKGDIHSPLMLMAQYDNVELAKRVLWESGYITERGIINSLRLPGLAIQFDSKNFLEFYLKSVRINEIEYVVLFLRAIETNALSCITVLINNFDKSELLLSTLITYACIHNQIELLHTWKEFDCNINQPCFAGMTPLMVACYSNEQTKRFISKLITLGVEFNLVDNHGRTALMYAASRNNEDIIQLLIKNGADTSLMDNEGRDYKYYLKNPETRDYNQLFLDRNREPLSHITPNRDDEIPKIRQNFYDRFEWYLQKYFERFPNGKNSDVYNSCFMDRRTFSKIRCKKNHKTPPHRETVISLALGLQLTLNEADDLMQCAGYHFSEKDKTDLEIVKLLSAKNYNGYDWSAKIYQKTGIIFFKSLDE